MIWAYDSANHLIRIGDRVKFRGRVYTIKEFRDTGKTFVEILFQEPQHTSEVATEISVDLVTGK